jgi:hypothetical protein
LPVGTQDLYLIILDLPGIDGDLDLNAAAYNESQRLFGHRYAQD